MIPQPISKKIANRQFRDFIFKYIGPFGLTLFTFVSLMMITPHIQEAQFIETVANKVKPAREPVVFKPSPCTDFQTATGVIYKGDNAVDFGIGKTISIKPIYLYSPSKVTAVTWTNNSPEYIKLSGGAHFQTNPYYSIDVTAMKKTSCDAPQGQCVYGLLTIAVTYGDKADVCTSSLKFVVK